MNEYCNRHKAACSMKTSKKIWSTIQRKVSRHAEMNQLSLLLTPQTLLPTNDNISCQYLFNSSPNKFTLKTNAGTLFSAIDTRILVLLCLRLTYSAGERPIFFAGHNRLKKSCLKWGCAALFAEILGATRLLSKSSSTQKTPVSSLCSY